MIGAVGNPNDWNNAGSSTSSTHQYVDSSPLSISVVNSAVDAQINSDKKFCRSTCISEVCLCVIVLAVVMGAALGLYFFTVPFLGLFLGAITPSIIMMHFLRRSFSESVIPCQMTITFFEAIAWMIPLTGLLILYSAVIEQEIGFPSSGSCPACIGSYAFTSFVLAGYLEETLKYLAIRRIMNNKLISDFRSLLVYGCCAGLGFATVENFLYVFISNSIYTAVVRAIISVPLHATTGCLMGLCLYTNISKENHEVVRYFKTIALPIALHGLFDFVLFTGVGVGTTTMAVVGFLLAVVIAFSGFAVLRVFYLKLNVENPVLSVHDLLEQGLAEKPCLSWEGKVCACCYK